MEIILTKVFRLMFPWYMEEDSKKIDIRKEQINKRDFETLINYFFAFMVKKLIMIIIIKRIINGILVKP